MRRELTPKLVRYLTYAGYAAVLLMPIQATAQQPNFEIKADVHVRADSFACKEISDLAADSPQELNCTTICRDTIAWN